MHEDDCLFRNKVRNMCGFSKSPCENPKGLGEGQYCMLRYEYFLIKGELLNRGSTGKGFCCPAWTVTQFFTHDPNLMFMERRLTDIIYTAMYRYPLEGFCNE